MPDAEKDAACLTDKEIELREWLRSQPSGAERWTVIKAGFRRSYDMGLRDAQTSVTPPAVAWCGGSHPGACHVPDSTGVCELSTRVSQAGDSDA